MLKSGSPKMTVSGIDHKGQVDCVWFTGPKQEFGNFPPDALKLFEEPQSQGTIRPYGGGGSGGWMGS